MKPSTQLTDLTLSVAVKITNECDSSANTHLQQLAKQLNLSVVKEGDTIEKFSFLLLSDQGRVSLKDLQQPKISPVFVDFVGGKANHRRQFGGGQGQMIAKAVGVSSKFRPHILDATAGLGGDAFVLASLNCRLTLIERNPIVAALLSDGIARAQMSDIAEVQHTAQRMHLLADNAVDYMTTLATEESAPDIVYVDPMFPERKKKAAVKKEMQFFHKLVGGDEDQDQLLDRALEIAEYRVVVKRPRIAPFIGNKTPSYQLTGKTSRYDIYALKKIPG